MTKIYQKFAVATIGAALSFTVVENITTPTAIATSLHLTQTSLNSNSNMRGYIIADGFSQVDTKPADFQNSTILSVAVSPSGEVFASKGFNIATVPFDGTMSSSISLPFTNSGVVVENMRFSPTRDLHLLMLNYYEPGSIRKQKADSFPLLVEFTSSQQFSRSFAFDSKGNFIVSGTFGSIGDPSWLLGYDSTGTQIFSVNSQKNSFIALAFDSNDVGYGATFDGQLFRISTTGNLSFVSQLPPEWVGNGNGAVESFAIDKNNNLFFGLGLGQRFGINSGAILRLHDAGKIDVLALGIGEIPVDMVFGPDNNLYVASFGVDSPGSRVFRINGDFSGRFATVPEPTSWLGLLVFSIGGTSLVLKRKQKG